MISKIHPVTVLLLSDVALLLLWLTVLVFSPHPLVTLVGVILTLLSYTSLWLAIIAVQKFGFHGTQLRFRIS